ncbi:MAG TPA: DUF1203 domain-containing protein [Gemmatimonadales bacterium]|nr:DUF1203 domain-containing protein [Gemmatimonadales bacterium]
MTGYIVTALIDEFAGQVRTTMKSPEYGHPVHRELASGTGPCRSCLDQFRVGKEERLLVTYRPPSADGSLGAPGPVFIHAEKCTRFDGQGFPPGLRSLPLLFEARAPGNRVVAAREATGEQIDVAIAGLLSHDGATHLHVRHGIAGCFIARVDRG